MTQITVNPELFTQGPNETVRKLNLHTEAIWELQDAVTELQDGPKSKFLQVVVFVNGELRTIMVGWDGGTPASL